MTLLRDALACLICEKPGPDLDYDHIKPRSTSPELRDGHPENLAPLCRRCHTLKGDQYFKTWVTVEFPGAVDEKLFYHWQGPTTEAPSGSREVAVDKRHGCLVPIEEVSHV